MIKLRDIGISCEFQQEWSQFFFWRKEHFNWYSFHFIYLYAEGGGYKGNYFELGIALLGFWFSFEVYHKPSRKEFSIAMNATIAEYEKRKQDNEMQRRDD